MDNAGNAKVYIHHEDCLATADRYPNGRFQLLFTSPPYPGRRGFTLRGALYESWLHARLGAWVPKVNRRGLVVLVYKFGRTPEGWFDLRQLDMVHDIELEHGLHCLDIYPWDKLNAPPGGAHDRHDRDAWEMVVVFARSPDYFYRPVRQPYAAKTITKALSGNMRQASVAGNMAGGHTRLHPNGARPDNVLRISSSGGDVARPRVAGGSFPSALPRRFIKQHTRPGDWVVDPFCGAGTTLVEALALGRPAVGVDVDETAARQARAWVAQTFG